MKTSSQCSMERLPSLDQVLDESSSSVRVTGSAWITTNLPASSLGCSHAPMPGRGGFFRGALDEGSVIRSSHKVMAREFD